MKRVLVILFLTAVVLSAVGFVALEIVSREIWSEEEKEEDVHYLLPSYLFARDRLGSLDGTDLERELESLKEIFGYPVALLDREVIPPDVADALRQGVELAFSDRGGDCYYLDASNADRVLRFGPLPPLAPPDITSRVLLWLILVSCFALSFWLVLRRTSRDLILLERASNAIAEGDLRARIERSLSRSPSFITAFNKMADRLQQVITSKQNLMRGVSHELRTPISRLELGAHLLRDRLGSPDDEKQIRALEKDIEELESLVEEILAHSKLESSLQEIAPAAIELRGALRAVVDRAKVRNEISIRIEPHSEADESHWELYADPSLFKRVVRNLLDNGARHASSEVVVEISKDGERLQVTFSDDGPGIPRSERERVFDPFVRLDNNAYQGHGLGLSLVREIVRNHGGEVFMDRSPKGGCRVVTRWPDRSDE